VGCNDSTCSFCTRSYNHTLDVCAATTDGNSALLTQTECSGGVAAQDKTTDLILNVLNNANCTTAFGSKLINLGNNVDCQPVGFIGNTYYYAQATLPLGKLVAIALCTDAACQTCTFPTETVSLYECQETVDPVFDSTYSWQLLTDNNITACEAAPVPGKSKLSTGAIAGIAAGSAVGVIGAVALGTYMVKAKAARAGYSNIDSSA
jgi:hypothetical protein